MCGVCVCVCVCGGGVLSCAHPERGVGGGVENHVIWVSIEIST